jgi:cell division protein FtsW (lipid II flippase)
MMFLSIEQIEFIIEDGDVICTAIIVCMAIVAALWYLAKSGREKLALIREEGGTSTLRVSKLDNTVGYAGSGADLQFPSNAGRKSKSFMGYFLGSMSSKPTWGFIPMGGGERMPVPEGSVSLIGPQGVEFTSFIGDKDPLRKRFDPAVGLLVIMMILSLALQMYLGIYASAHYTDLISEQQMEDIGQGLATEAQAAGTSPEKIFSLGIVEFALLIGMFAFSSGRLGPENIFVFLLSFLGYLAFPSPATYNSVLIGWVAYTALPYFLNWFLPRMKTWRLNLPKLEFLDLNVRNILVLALLAIVMIGAFNARKSGYVQFMGFQVGDLTLLILMLMCISGLNAKKLLRDCLWTLGVMAAASFAIYFGGETGTAAVIALVAFIIVVVRGSSFLVFKPYFVAAVCLVALFMGATGVGALIQGSSAEGAVQGDVSTSNTVDRISGRLDRWRLDYPVDDVDYSQPLQVERLRVLAASGGDRGFGLYGGEYRHRITQAGVDLVSGILLEELGMVNGSLIVFLIFMVAAGYCFQGVKALKLHYSLICYAAAFFIGVRAFINFVSSTGMAFAVGPFRIGIPVVGLPMPFLSRAGSAGLILFICLAFAEASKVLTGQVRKRLVREA